jgi:hypothetical protein
MSWAPKSSPSAARPTASTSTTKSARRTPRRSSRPSGPTRRITASHSTATPTACRWWTPTAASSTATKCCFSWSTSAWRAVKKCPAQSARLMTNMAVEVALKKQGRRICTRQGRRPLCARRTRQARLAAGRRGLRPPAGARQAHHRRRPHQRPAGAASLRAQRQDDCPAAQRGRAVSADVDQCAPEARPGLEEQQATRRHDQNGGGRAWRHRPHT